MATTNFITGTTITADWLNDVDAFTYTLAFNGRTLDLTDNTLTGTMAEFNTACSDGNFVYQGVGQIAFPATQNASADPNTLDDYEEGTFTPTVTFSTPGDLAVTYTEQVGRYTKIGDMVYISLRIWTNTFTYTTASGTLRFPIPFTPTGTTPFWLNAVTDGAGYTWPATRTQVKGRADGGASFLLLKGLGGLGTDSFTATEVPTGSTVIVDIDGWIKV